MPAFQKAIDQVIKKTEEHGYEVKQEAKDYLINQCRQAQKSGSILVPKHCKIAAAGLVAAGITALDKKKMVIDVAEIEQGWRIIRGEHCVIHDPSCLFNSIIKMKKNNIIFNELTETLLVEELEVELSESGND
jgi:hypothetical protein